MAIPKRGEASNLSSLNASLNNTSLLNTSVTHGDEDLSPALLKLKQKRQAQKEKLARLQSYGRAPCLSPLPTTSIISPAASKAFKPPTPSARWMNATLQKEVLQTSDSDAVTVTPLQQSRNKPRLKKKRKRHQTRIQEYRFYSTKWHIHARGIYIVMQLRNILQSDKQKWEPRPNVWKPWGLMKYVHFYFQLIVFACLLHKPVFLKCGYFIMVLKKVCVCVCVKKNESMQVDSVEWTIYCLCCIWTH
jgi:hypothetical protein